MPHFGKTNFYLTKREFEKITEARQADQSKLTAECWDVQFWGLEKCETCQWKDSDECGGQEIRKTGKNKKGYSVPIGKKIDPKDIV